MQVFAPEESRVFEYSYHAHAGEIEMTDENNDSGTPMSPEGDNVVATKGKTGNAASVLPILAGEEITSFRQCIKRYSQHAILANGMTAPKNSLGFFIHKQPAFPYMYGYEPLGVDLDGATQCNRCTFTILNYLSGAYAGWRGSLRWKIVPFKAPCCSWLLEARRCGSDCNYEDNWVTQDLSAIENINPTVYSRNVREMFQADMAGGWDGSTATATQHNPVLEFEIPYYNDARFLTISENTALDSSEGMGWWLRNSVAGDSDAINVRAADRVMMMNTYVAAGEDFNFYFFQGVPLLYETFL
jgi:hypothetical protein